MANQSFTNIFDAARDGTVDDVRYFIDRIEISINVFDDENDLTPLHYAARHNSVEVVQLLISHGSDVNAKSDNGWTPLHGAAHNSVEVVQLLISHGSDVNAKNWRDETPLH